MTGSTTFCLTLCSTDLAEKVARITSDSVNLSTILLKYHEFTNIFSKNKVETLAPYYLYDLQIKLENECYCHLSSHPISSFSHIKKLAKLAK